MDETNETMIDNISIFFDDICSKNDKIINEDLSFHNFKTRLYDPIRTITFYNLIRRIHYRNSDDVAVLITATFNIIRLVKKNKKLIVNYKNIKKIFVTSYTLSLKFLDDHIVKNSMVAKYGYILWDELNLLEMIFLKKIDYDMFVSVDEYNKMLFILTNLE